MLLSSRTDSAIEGWPVHEEEESAYHSDEIRNIVSMAEFVFIFNCFSRLIEERCSQTKISTEGVNNHASTNIDSVENVHGDSFIQGVEDDVNGT
jgi:hypothetical protein